MADCYIQELRQRSYQIYLTDCASTLANNSALLARAWGCSDAKVIEGRWADLFKKQEEPKSGGEIAAGVILAGGLKVRTNIKE